MCAKVFLLLCLLELANAASTYDQRQNGNLNIQVDLNDLRIVALMKGGKEEYVDYDYAYDYSEMTIKPQNGTTPKPLNVTSTTSTLSAANQSSVIQNDNSTMMSTAASATMAQTTVSTDNDSLSQTFAMSSTTTINPVDVDSTAGATETVEPLNSSKLPILSSTVSPSAPNCKKGFIMNLKGDCEFKLHGPGNALMKLVKLSQRLKLRRENRKDGPGFNANEAAD